MKKKKIIIALFCVISSCFALESSLCDAQGRCANVDGNFDILSQLHQKKGYKSYYVIQNRSDVETVKTSYIHKSASKINGRKRWYEVDWNQGVKLCPEYDLDAENGFWIVNGSAHVDSNNCVYVDGSPYTRSILVRFVKNDNDLQDADSSWILVNQAIVELAGKKFKVWKGYHSDRGMKNPKSGYVEVTFNQDLIVDKSEFRLRDAIWLDQMFNRQKAYYEFHREPFYPSSDTMSLLDYPAKANYHYGSYRSAVDGLNVPLRKDVLLASVDTNQVFYELTNHVRMSGWVLDTAANGYREPTEIEWQVLQRGGTDGVFLWGDSNSEEELGKYASIDCADKTPGVHPVEQYLPNAFGLYDVYGNAEENPWVIEGRNFREGYDCLAYDFDKYDIGAACLFLSDYRCNSYEEPMSKETYKYVYRVFEGFRLVRKLE